MVRQDRTMVRESKYQCGLCSHNFSICNNSINSNTANNNTNAAGCIKNFGVYLHNNVNEVVGNVKNNNNVQRNAVDQRKKGIYNVQKLLFVLVYRK